MPQKIYFVATENLVFDFELFIGHRWPVRCFKLKDEVAVCEIPQIDLTAFS